MNKFPKTFAAFQRAEANKLTLGKAIIEETRKLNSYGWIPTLADISEDLKANGFDYSVPQLAQLRRKARE